jgi:hypothetical protein
MTYKFNRLGNKVFSSLVSLGVVEIVAGQSWQKMPVLRMDRSLGAQLGAVEMERAFWFTAGSSHPQALIQE